VPQAWEGDGFRDARRPLASPETGLSHSTAVRRALIGVRLLAPALLSHSSSALIDIGRAAGTAENLHPMRKSLPLAVVLLGLPSCVLANHGDALLLGQQVITASRTGHSPVSIASSSLITRDEIERQQAGSVPELLQRLD